MVIKYIYSLTFLLILFAIANIPVYAQGDCGNGPHSRVAAYIIDEAGNRYGQSDSGSECMLDPVNDCSDDLSGGCVPPERAPIDMYRSTAWIKDIRWVCDGSGRAAGGMYQIRTWRCSSGGDQIPSLTEADVNALGYSCADVEWQFYDIDDDEGDEWGNINNAGNLMLEGTGCTARYPWPGDWNRQLFFILKDPPGEAVGGRVIRGNSIIKDRIDGSEYSFTTNSDGSYNLLWGSNGGGLFYHLGRWDSGANATVRLNNPDPAHDVVWSVAHPSPQNTAYWGYSSTANFPIQSGDFSIDWQNHLWFHLTEQPPNMNAICQGESVRVSWDSVPGVQEYIVRMNKDPYNDWGDPAAIGDIWDQDISTDRTYDNDDFFECGEDYKWNLQYVLPGDSYFHKTRFWDWPVPDPGGRWDPWDGNTISCPCIPDVEPPPPPEGDLQCAYVSTSAGQHWYNVTYSWDAVVDLPLPPPPGLNSPPVQYQAQMSTNSTFPVGNRIGTNWRFSRIWSSAPGTLYPVPPNTTVYARVRARDSEEVSAGGPNVSDWSDPIDSINIPSQCTVTHPVVCGDGVEEGAEECDVLGPPNQSNNDICPNDPAGSPLGTCQDAECGDGFLCTAAACDTAGLGPEICDDGDRNNNDSCPDDGNSGGTCQAARCGDGHVWDTDGGSEACDDGDLDFDDDQLSGVDEGPCVVDLDDNPGGSCQENVCGDGYWDAAEEECDDGNASNTDGCSVLCNIVPESNPYCYFPEPAP